jgi:hypothetical protein
MYPPVQLLYAKKNKENEIKWAKDLSSHFSKEDIQMSNKHENKVNVVISH